MPMETGRQHPPAERKVKAQSTRGISFGKKNTLILLGRQTTLTRLYLITYMFFA
jgi:hypothetical protein